MKLPLLNFLLFLLPWLGVGATLNAQSYVDQFDGTDQFVSLNGGFAAIVANSELTLQGDGTGGAFAPVVYQFNDGSMAGSTDITPAPIVYVRAKASTIATQLRVDVVDAAGFATSLRGITKTLTNDYVVYEYDFTGLLVDADGGFGGTPCNATTQPCNVDGSTATSLQFFVDPGVGGFDGDLVIDYVSVGEPAGSVITSDVFQDHFDGDSSLTSFVEIAAGHTAELTGTTELTITGDGSGGQFAAFAYDFRNNVTWESVNLDFTDGDNKLYVKMKSTVPGTAIRFDLQDADLFSTTAGSITRIVGTDYEVFEYDYSGLYQDLGFGGTPCTQTTAPCPVDPTRINNLVMFINPGTGGFAGELTIDYISVGTSLDPAGPAPVVVYEDEFDNNAVDSITSSAGSGYSNSEMGSEWTITGDGTAGAFATVSYLPNDKVTGQRVTIDITPAQAKLFLKMKTNTGNEPVRVDIIDTMGRVSSLTSATRIVGTEFETLVYDFTGAQDGGFDPNNPACTSADAPCPLDLTAINQLLFYIRAADGGFAGDLVIDYLAFGGSPTGGGGGGGGGGPTGLVDFRDDFNGNSSLFLQTASGFTTSFDGDAIGITGDGTAGAFAALKYDFHNAAGDLIIVDSKASGDTLFVRAKANPAVPLRIDFLDNQGFVTSIDAVTNTIENEYSTLAYVFNSYADGGFGGAPCTTGPCPVDAERISSLLIYPDPTNGGYAGQVDIDFVAFGSDAVSSTSNPTEIKNVSVFPNPTRDMLTIDYALQQSGQIDISIIDGVGRQVMNNFPSNRGIGNQREEISLEALPIGIYQVCLKFNGKIAESITVVKQ